MSESNTDRINNLYGFINRQGYSIKTKFSCNNYYFIHII